MGLMPGGLKSCSLWGEMLRCVRLNMLMLFGPVVQKEKVAVSSWNYACMETLSYLSWRGDLSWYCVIIWSAI